MGQLTRTARESDVDTPKATCHPRRATFMDGLCRPCFEKQLGGGAEGAVASTKAAEILAMVESVHDIDELGRKAREILQLHLPHYAKLHYQGAKIAALRGDTRPAEWALQAVKTPKGDTPVAPPTKTAPEAGVKVYIGVGLGNLPVEAINATVIELPPTDPVSNE